MKAHDLARALLAGPDFEIKTADDALKVLRNVADELSKSNIEEVGAVGEAEGTNLRSVTGADYRG